MAMLECFRSILGQGTAGNEFDGSFANQCAMRLNKRRRSYRRNLVCPVTQAGASVEIAFIIIDINEDGRDAG